MISSSNDYGRIQQRSIIQGSTPIPVPDAINMFSDVSHYPRGRIVMHPSQPIPQQATIDYNGIMTQHLHTTQHQHAAAEPTGKDFLLKHFYRPRMPYHPGQNNTTLVRLAKVEVKQSAIYESAGSRTVGTQSDYRESDTQTDPWTPEYIVRPGSAPEVLTLATLAYGHGLPAGLAEVEMIERARAKRVWEASLPDASTAENAALRMKMMEEQELLEWKLREKEIEKLQEQRISMLAHQVAARTAEQNEKTSQKLDALWQQRNTEHQQIQARANKDTLVQLRRLSAERASSVPPAIAVHRDIIAEYANPASNVFAPVSRTGGFSQDDVPADNRVRSRYLSTFDGLLELEASLPSSFTQPRITVPLRPESRPMYGSVAKTTGRLQATLSRVYDSMTGPPRATTTPGPLRFCEKIIPPPARPPTPVAAPPSPGSEEKDQAILMLQALLRGRAMQNEMYVGRTQRKELLVELRSNHALQEASIAAEESKRQKMNAERNTQQKAQQYTKLKEGIILDVQAELVGDTLDFLSKELVRLQEQRRIHAFAMLADRSRRMREAEESGKRQVEEARRKQNDEVFRQVVGVHNESVETYLEDIILTAKNAVANSQARAEVRQQAIIIDQLSSSAHINGYDMTTEGAEALTADLVMGFLLPEVQRQTQRDHLARQQNRFLHAAHLELRAEAKVVDETVDTKLHASRPTSRPSSRPATSKSSRASSATGARASSSRPGTRGRDQALSAVEDLADF